MLIDNDIREKMAEGVKAMKQTVKFACPTKTSYQQALRRAVRLPILGLLITAPGEADRGFAPDCTLARKAGFPRGYPTLLAARLRATA